MNLDQSHIQTATNRPAPSRTGTHLRGGWLVLARAAWVVMTLLILGLNIAALPHYDALLQAVCTVPAKCFNDQLTAADMQGLHASGSSIGVYATLTVAVQGLSVLLCVILGALLFWRRSDEPMALFCAFMLVMFSGAGITNILQEGLAPLSLSWYALVYLLDFLGQVSFLLFFYLFPSGRFVPRWTRWTALLFAGLEAWTIITFSPGAFTSGPEALAFFGLLLTPVVAQVYRYRHVSTPEQRQQTKWVVFALALTIVGFISLLSVIHFFFPTGLLSAIVDNIIGTLALTLLIPCAIVIAILRSHLWDIDLIISRTLVYGMLTACVVALYVLVVVGLGALLQSSGNLLISLLATGLVAVLFQPLREQLQRAVNRLMYGERDTPYRVISRLGQRLEATLAPDEMLPTIVETVAQALKLPYVAITLKQEGELVTAASYGVPKESLTYLPLVYHTEQIGELLLAPHASGETFTPADRVLLDDLARQTGVAAHAVRLSADLQRLATDVQRSREHLVTAREEERRRLRRDLHDGLGPTLATIIVKAEAAHDAITAEPAQAMTLLEELIGQAQTAIADIRRLVYNLRPPALDDLGLIVAIRAQAMHYEHPGLHVSVEAPEPLPELPAAVEVAAYRIMQEALTNVVRHANARSCLIRLTFDGALHLEITDDGCGLPADRQAGVGLRSMQERAVEVGGSYVIEALPSKGTRVQASLPCSSYETH